ncbi:integrase family protein [Rhizobium leguminosarum]|uniref:VPA1269 family protein n=1 Tax=Rhizobium leguminosarum TaxID=384 RepID=UPI001CDC4FFE|nr:VPA1269 family protein [Rhizobium leguminosarum]MCA2431207.1 integrase family protein [Rhizobium leguminosarum]
MVGTLRFVEFLFILWKHELIAFPAAQVWALGASDISQGYAVELSDRFFGDMAEILKSLVAPLKHSGQARAMVRFMLAFSKPQEIGDIDYGVLELFQPYALKGNHQTLVYGVCDQLHAQQRTTYQGDRRVELALPQSYREIFIKKKGEDRSSETFAWAITRGGPRVEMWRSQLAAYLASIPNRIGLRYEVTQLNLVLDYVIEHEDVPDVPVEYCRRNYKPTVSLASYQDTARNTNESRSALVLRCIARFFDWVIAAHGSDEDGVPYREYQNPVDIEDLPTWSRSKGQTDRAAMPLRFLKMIREIIEGDDFAWPKTLPSDYLEHLDPKTGKRSRIWSPVRAEFFLLRLMLPIRSLQTRLLDSGEGDFDILASDHIWKRNTGRHAPAKKSDRRDTGLVRRIWDHHSGRAFNGLFITTNKTQDREELFTESGYEIPWENADVMKLFCRLRDWQVKYNPVVRPLSRAELKSDKKQVVSGDVADRLDKLFFLFRDAADRDFPHEPPTEGRLNSFWRLLVAELERRLEETGQRNSDGSKIQLVTFREKGTPKSSIFDMHSLRVSGLTAFINAGVPIHILSEFVAGHATVLMTLYYHKPGAAEITRVLDDAIEEMSVAERGNWDAFLKSQPAELLHEIAAYNSEEGLLAAKATQSSLWAPMAGGICPNGATLCDKGGPLLNEGKQVYAPVPGGSKNCPVCRFFVTGPAYLGGLVAAFNQTGGQIRELFGFLEESQANRRILVSEHGTNPKDRKISAEMVTLDEAVQTTQSKLDSLSQTWVSQLRLIQKVEKILESRANDNHKNALVLNGQLGDLRVSLEQSTEFEMWDRICQSSVFYPNVDARLPAIRRGRLFDLMLKRNGRTPVFATLTDRQLVGVGNEAANLLRSIIGDPNIEDVLAGRQALDDLGIGRQFDDFVQQRIDGGAVAAIGYDRRTAK